MDMYMCNKIKKIEYNFVLHDDILIENYTCDSGPIRLCYLVMLIP